MPLLSLSKREKKELKLYKIGKYLQEVVMIRQVCKIYAVCSFFDIKNCRKFMERFRFRVRQDNRDRYSMSSAQSESNRTHSSPVIPFSPENGHKRIPEVPSYLSNRISDILNDLGN